MDGGAEFTGALGVDGGLFEVPELAEGLPLAAFYDARLYVAALGWFFRQADAAGYVFDELEAGEGIPAIVRLGLGAREVCGQRWRWPLPSCRLASARFTASS